MKAQESRFSDHKQEGRSHIHIQQKAATEAYEDIKNQADRKETNIGLVDAVGSGLGSLASAANTPIYKVVEILEDRKGGQQLSQTDDVMKNKYREHARGRVK